MTTLLPNLPQDLRYALRQLRRAPGFALTAVLTLALGIGANTAIFSLLDQALLRSLPVRDPQQLVVLEGTGKLWEGHTGTHGGDTEAYFSYPMYQDLRDHSQAFQGLIATAPADIGLAHNGSSIHARAELVSGNYFTVLGVHPALGRLLTPADDLAPNANPLAVLSYDLWRDQLGADSSILNTTVSLNGHPYQVIGIAARGFHSAVWGQTPGVFVPMAMLAQIIPGKGNRLTDHTDRWLNILGRLKSGESYARAEAATQPLWHALRAEELKALGTRSPHFVEDFLSNSRLRVLPGAKGFSYERNDVQAPLLVVMAMALLVLAIAAINVASLMLLRSAGRVREFSLRFALGAAATRIAQQLLLEGLLIGIAAGAVAMALAPLAARALVHQVAGDQAFTPFSTAIDSRVLVFNFAVALAVSVLFSLTPALQLRRPDLTLALRQTVSTGTAAKLSLRRIVVSLQIGLSVVLLVGAGLFVRTMQKLRMVDTGFNTTHLVTFGINPKLAGYGPAAIPALHQHIVEALSSLPGVLSAGATTVPELAGDDNGGNVSVSGYTAPPEENFDVQEAFVNPGYFSTLQIPLVAGRLFTETDDSSHPNVAVVNQSFARHFCGSAQACIGRRMSKLKSDSSNNLSTEIIGVVRDVRHLNLRDTPLPSAFNPIRQDSNPGQLFLYVRTFAAPADMVITVRRAMQQLDAGLFLVGLRTMDAQIDDSLSNERLISLLAVAFGLLATLLAGIGLYGVLAYATTQRTREIGIRFALGSTRVAVSRLIVVDVLLLAGIGVGVALPVALGLGRLLRRQLFGVSVADPVTLAAAVVLITAVALVAAIVPVTRAASVNPTEALRAE